MTNISFTLFIAILAVFLSSFVMAAISAGLMAPFLNIHFKLHELFFKLLVCIEDLESFINICKSDHFIFQFSPREFLVSIPAISCGLLSRLISALFLLTRLLGWKYSQSASCRWKFLETSGLKCSLLCRPDKKIPDRH